MVSKNEYAEIVNQVISMLENAYHRLLDFNEASRNKRIEPKLLHEHLLTVMPEEVAMILTNHLYTYRYATEIIDDRNDDIEAVLLSSPHYIYLYAMNIICCRDAEVEKVLVKSPHYACLYAKNMIGGRWLEAELTIASNSESDALYRKLLTGWYKSE